MIRRYKTLIEGCINNESFGSISGNEIITVFANGIDDAIDKTEAKLERKNKQFPSFKYKILYGPKLSKEFNPAEYVK